MSRRFSKTLVALVGRPNVGKSTMFNMLVRARKAIVEDTPGLTRDRNYAEATIRDKSFIVVDTGGFEPTTDTAVGKSMYAEFGFAREGTCPQISVVTPEDMAAEQRDRCPGWGWGLFLGVGLALFVLAYRKHRSESQHSPPALGE